jgi:outer membrane cobalamin receptor
MQNTQLKSSEIINVRIRKDVIERVNKDSVNRFIPMPCPAFSIQDSLFNIQYFLFFFLFLVSSLPCFAQEGMIKGIVTDSSGSPIPHACICTEGEGCRCMTDIKGEFTIEKIKEGTHRLKVTCFGYQPLIREITVKPGETLKLKLVLKEEIHELEQVEIIAKSKADELKESPQAVTVIEAKKYYGQSSSTADIINRSAGIRVRQDGGLGSAASFSINGISGKQVKFFLDGIPIDYYGAGMNINVIPVNQMERIEIYKGVVPISLGGDALGGAINIVSRKSWNSYADVSYSYGSFNTHKANLSSRIFLDSSSLFIGLQGFYNYSDNNYKIDVEVPNQFGNPEKRTVRRFHDRFSGYMGRIEAGLVNKKFADELVFGIMTSGINKEIQHNLIMSQPYGQAEYGQTSFGSTVKYQKYDLFKNLSADIFAGYNRNTSRFIDTTLNVYTWDGKVFTRKQYGGEISTSMNNLRLNSDNVIGRINLKYRINSKQSITFSSLHYNFYRKGTDPVAADYYQQDLFANPVTMYKQVSGLSYETKLFKEKLTSITSAKFYYFRSSGFSIDHGKSYSSVQHQDQLGISQAFKYQFNEKFLMKSSYEYATRLPDEYELFGDFYLLQPNAQLVPETSHNGNLGFIYKKSKYSFELNGFYRYVDEIIYLRTAQNFAQYQNLLKAEIKGVEFETILSPYKNFYLTLNATWQDLRSRTPVENSGTLDDRYIGARIPNIPYFFSNGEIRYEIKNFFKKNTLQLWWNANYIHSFFLYWEIDGRKDSKYAIPSQLIQNTGLSCSIPETHITISAEAFNLFNMKAYDNFGVQKPGRAFSMKLRYFINNFK